MGINRIDSPNVQDFAGEFILSQTTPGGDVTLSFAGGADVTRVDAFASLEVVLQPSDDSSLGVTTGQLIRATNIAILDNIYAVIGTGTTITSSSMLGGAQFQLVSNLVGKQDTIIDLATIRSGAALGATSSQTDTNTQLTAATILAVLNGATGDIDADLLRLASGGNNIIFQPIDGTTIVIEEGDLVIASLPSLFGNWYLIGANPPSLTSVSNFANAAFVLQYTNTDLKADSVTVNPTTRAITGPGGSIVIPVEAGEAVEFTPADHDITEFRDVTSAGSGVIITAQERIDFAVDTNTQLTAATILDVLNGASGNIDADLLSLATGDSLPSGVVLQPTGDTTLVAVEGDVVIATAVSLRGNIYSVGAGGPGTVNSGSGFTNAAFTLRGNLATDRTDAENDARYIEDDTNTQLVGRNLTIKGVSLAIPAEAGEAVAFVPGDHNITEFADVPDGNTTVTAAEKTSIGTALQPAALNTTADVLPKRGVGNTLIDSQIRENVIGSGDDEVTHVQIGTVENPSQLNLKGQLFLNTGLAGNLGNVPFVPLGEVDQSVYTFSVDGDGAITHGATTTSSLGRTTFISSQAEANAIGLSATDGQFITVEGGSYQVSIFHQLQYGPNSTPTDLGEGFLPTDVYLTGFGASGESIGNDPVFDGTEVSRYNLQINFPDSSTGSPDTTLGRYDLLANGVAVNLNTINVRIAVRQNVPDQWIIAGQTEDSSQNGHEGRIRIARDSSSEAAFGTDASPNILAGACLGLLENVTLADGLSYVWNQEQGRFDPVTPSTRTVSELPGGPGGQSSTPSYEDNVLVQNGDIVFLQGDATATFGKDIVPTGLWRYRLVSQAIQGWVALGKSDQYNNHIIYGPGETIFNEVNDAETPFRAIIYTNDWNAIGIFQPNVVVGFTDGNADIAYYRWSGAQASTAADIPGVAADWVLTFRPFHFGVEPGAASNWESYWTRLNPYVGETLEEVEDGIRVQQTGIGGVTTEQIDLFNIPATGSTVTPTHWRLTLNEGETDAANIATLPELISSSKWGAAPTGTRPDPLTWDVLTATGTGGGTGRTEAEVNTQIDAIRESSNLLRFPNGQTFTGGTGGGDEGPSTTVLITSGDTVLTPGQRNQVEPSSTANNLTLGTGTNGNTTVIINMSEVSKNVFFTDENGGGNSLTMPDESIHSLRNNGIGWLLLTSSRNPGANVTLFTNNQINFGDGTSQDTAGQSVISDLTTIRNQAAAAGPGDADVNSSHLAIPINSSGIFVDSNVRQTGIGGAADVTFVSGFGNSTHGIFQANPENGVIGLELGTVANPRGLAITGRTELKTVSATTQTGDNITVATVDSGGVIGSTSINTTGGELAANFSFENDIVDDSDVFGTGVDVLRLDVNGSSIFAFVAARHLELDGLQFVSSGTVLPLQTGEDFTITGTVEGQSLGAVVDLPSSTEGYRIAIPTAELPAGFPTGTPGDEGAVNYTKEQLQFRHSKLSILDDELYINGDRAATRQWVDDQGFGSGGRTEAEINAQIDAIRTDADTLTFPNGMTFQAGTGDGGTGIFTGQSNTLPDVALSDDDDLYYDNGVGVFRVQAAMAGALSIDADTLAQFLVDDATSVSMDMTLVTGGPLSSGNAEFRTQPGVSGSEVFGAADWNTIQSAIIVDTGSTFPLTDLVIGTHTLFYGDADNWAIFEKTAQGSFNRATLSFVESIGVVAATFTAYFDTSVVDVMTARTQSGGSPRQWVNDIAAIQGEVSGDINVGNITSTSLTTDAITATSITARETQIVTTTSWTTMAHANSDRTSQSFFHINGAITIYFGTGSIPSQLSGDLVADSVVSGSLSYLPSGVSQFVPTSILFRAGAETLDFDIIGLASGPTSNDIQVRQSNNFGFLLALDDDRADNPSVVALIDWLNANAVGVNVTVTMSYAVGNTVPTERRLSLTELPTTPQTAGILSSDDGLVAIGALTGRYLLDDVVLHGTFQDPPTLATPTTGYDITLHKVLDGVGYYIHYLETSGSTSKTLTTTADTNTIIFQYNIN